MPCLRRFIPEVGCDLTDTACQCRPAKQAELLPKIQGCLLDACNPADLARAAGAASSACEAFAGSATGSGALSLPTNSGQLSSLIGSLSEDVSSLIGSLTEDISSAIETGSESVTETGSESATETGSETGSATETGESGSASEGGASATSSEGGNGAAATAAPMAGMAIAAIIAAAL